VKPVISENKFRDYVEREKKSDAIDWILKKMKSGELTVRSLYNEVILPTIQTWECPFQEDPLCIWKEHVLTSTVRTVIEIIYPFVLKEREKSNGKKIIITCPSEEYHEIAPRIVSDWFELNGFDTIFAGSNTPRETLMAAVQYEKPDYTAISVSNTYNLFKAQDMINEIKAAYPEQMIIVGGRAFMKNPGMIQTLDVELFLKDFDDIDAFSRKMKGSDVQ